MTRKISYLMYWRDHFIGHLHQKITDVGGVVGIWEPSNDPACREFREISEQLDHIEVSIDNAKGTRVILKKTETSRAGHALVLCLNKSILLKEENELVLERFITKSHVEKLISSVN